MRWEIAQNMRCDIIAFSGINFSGRRATMQIYPSGKKGDLELPEVGSITIMGPIGTRVVLCTSSSDDWEEHAWRAVELHKGVAYIGRSGLPTVRIPDIDAVDKVNVERTDPDFQASPPIANTLADGKDKGWTYGRPGDLKGRIQMIRVEKNS